MPRLNLIASSFLLACGSTVSGTDTDGEDGSGGSGGSETQAADETGTTGSTTDTTDTSAIPVVRQVDVLFVIDNSGSMGEEQGMVAQALPDLVAALESASPPVDYRIAFTTTDNGNPWCNTTSPEAGAFITTSCRSRQSEFVFNGATTVDVTQEACLDVCSLDSVVLSGPSRWVESIDGVTNVGAESLTDVLSCIAPQGINGCGFEQPLESANKAIQRALSPEDPQFGFIEPGALLAVIIVSDEVDCSHNDAYSDIFLPDGDQAFWSLPLEGSPTSAVCWNAGVSCVGQSPYSDCEGVNKAQDGTEGVGDADAVLYPRSRYTAALAGMPTFVAGVLGVPAGYVEGGPISYADGGDPQFLTDFGIGPGCESATARAVPPVRIREVAEVVNGGERSLYSICAPNFEDALSRIGKSIVDKLP